MFGEIMPSGSSNNTSIRESAVLAAAAALQVLDATISPAAPILPLCRKSLRRIDGFSAAYNSFADPRLPKPFRRSPDQQCTPAQRSHSDFLQRAFQNRARRSNDLDGRILPPSVSAVYRSRGEVGLLLLLPQTERKLNAGFRWMANRRTLG